MAESTLALQRTGFQKSIGLLLGYGLDSSKWKADDRLKIDHCLETGERRVYSPVTLPGEAHSHSWSFLRPVVTNIVLNAAYVTTTVQVAPDAGGSIVTLNGAVVPSDGGWPTWAADGQIVINDQAYDVASRTSSTVLRLIRTDVTIAAGTIYSLQQDTYTLDDLFGGIEGDLYFSSTSGSNTWPSEVRRIDHDEILLMTQQNHFTNRPYFFSVHPVATTGTDFQRKYITVYPSPDASYTLTGRMIVNPYKMTAALPYPLGGYEFTELLRESCLAAAESEIKGEANGPHYQLFMQRLAAAVSHDRRQDNPRTLGQMRGSFCWPTTGAGTQMYRDVLRNQSAVVSYTDV